MTTQSIAGCGLRDGTQYTMITCACGFQSPARSDVAAASLQASHKSSCDWTAPTSPNGPVVVGTSASAAPLTAAAIAARIGAAVGVVPTTAVTSPNTTA